MQRSVGRVMAILLVFGGVAAPVALGTDAEAVRDLIDRSIAFHGGALYTSSRTTLRLCSKSGCSELEAERDGGMFEYCAAAQVEGRERRVCMTNDHVQERLDGVAPLGATFPGTPAHEARERSLRDWVMERLYFAFLPSRLDDPSVRLEDLGSESWDGRVLRKVKVTFELGSSTDADDEYLYWFDPETARLEQFAYSYERNGGGLRFRKLINYRRVGGILFFDQENFGVEGPDLAVEMITSGYVEEAMRHVSTIQLEEIEVTALE